MKLDCAARLLIALCTMAVACRSVSGGSDDNAQCAPDQAGAASTAPEPEPEAPARDVASAGRAAVDRECMGRVPGEEFCDGNTVRTCVDGSASAVLKCGELERCVTQGDRVLCACQPGAVDTGGGCLVVASCGSDNGGCDWLTECRVIAQRRTCGACPTGYAGDGERGCEPLLISLVADGGELTPAFAPDVFSYRVKLPPMREQLSLTSVAPSQVQIEVNGAILDPGSPWTSPVWSPGEHAIELVLTGNNGITTHYEIIVERSES